MANSLWAPRDPKARTPFDGIKVRKPSKALVRSIKKKIDKLRSERVKRERLNRPKDLY